ncbi:MAG: DsrE/DsrF/DrsH-like family protein [Magnetococcales bacterium]|nr:DsrE/DsrF/DrsH-like family protein [Magnetococcales bacterium]
MHTSLPVSELSAMVDQAVAQRISKELLPQMHNLQSNLEQRLNALEQRLPKNRISIVLFSGDLDRALAGFIIANGALAMDMEVAMYFTFWGMAAIKQATNSQGKEFRQRLMGLFTPERSEEMGLSQLNMLGIGSKMMKSMMRARNISSLEELRNLALEMDARFIACTMAMELMGIRQEELVKGIQLGGVATFMESALNSRLTLFI